MPSAGPCDKCPLHENAVTVNVLGRGPDNPEILIVGEAPGRQEDKNGVPFVGPSGQMLERMMATAGLNPATTRFTNINRCVPWQDANRTDVRPPTDKERDACVPHLREEILRTKPKIIVAVGGTSCKFFTGKGQITKARGARYAFRPYPEEHPTFAVPVVPIIHPAAVLRGNKKYEVLIAQDLSYVRKLLNEGVQQEKLDYAVIREQADLTAYVDALIGWHQAGQLPYIAVDCETMDLDAYKLDKGLLSIQVSHTPGSARLIPVSHDESPFNDSAGMAFLVQELKRLLETVPVVGHNYRFDYAWIYAKLGIMTRQFVFDTMMAHHALYVGEMPNDLKFMAAKYTTIGGYENELQQFIATLPKGKQDMANVPLDVLARYGCGDSDATLRIAQLLIPELHKKGLWDMFKELYLDVWTTATWMEINGAYVDQDRWAKLMDEYPTILEKAAGEIHKSPFHRVWSENNKTPFKRKRGQKPTPDDPEFVYPDLNPGSWMQLQNLLYEVMKMPKIPGDTKGGTDKTTLKELRDNCKNNGWDEHGRVIEAILEYKKYAKRYSAYVSGMPKLIAYRGEEGPERATKAHEPPQVPFAVHPKFNLGGTLTGRLSSSQPNMQQLPPKSEEKALFISRWHAEGGMMAEADYAQIEYRVFAQLSGDPGMIDAFTGGKDIHRYIASRVFLKPEEQITYDERRMAKTATFAILYGASPETVSKGQELTPAQAKQVIEDFWKQFPLARKWYDGQHAFAHKHGYVTTPTGRVRSLRAMLDEGTRSSIAGAMRRAVNSPVQGAASDITLTSLARVWNRCLERGMRSLPISIVHDALVFDVAPGEALDFYHLLYEEMISGVRKQFPWLEVPLSADYEIGISWGYMAEVVLDQNDYNHVIYKGRATWVKDVIRALKLSHDVQINATTPYEKDGHPCLEFDTRIAPKIASVATVPA